MTMVEKVRSIVQRWLDTGERDYPSYRALRELAILLHLERGKVYVPRRRRAKAGPDPRQLDMWGAQ